MSTGRGHRLIDLVGQTFGRLTVVARAAKNPEHANRQARWACTCSCGGKTEVIAQNLKKGIVNSCGCLRREAARRAIAENRRAEKQPALEAL